MPLGEQFRNTYWFTDQGNMINALDTGKGSPEYTMGEELPEGFDKPIQGMLFSPHTGTHQRHDPLVPHADRVQAINEALGYDDSKIGDPSVHDAYYRDNLTREWKVTGKLKKDPNFKTFPSKEDTSKDRQSLVNSMDNSGMTIDEIKGVNAEAVIDPATPYNGPAFHRSGPEVASEGGRIVIAPTHDANSLSMSLMHEVGHSRDTSISDRRHNLWSHTKRVKNADPVQEGLADAHMDRHHTYKDVYPEHMVNDLTNRLARGDDGGYGLSHWTSQHDKALYAATRIAAAQSPDAFSDIPTRTELAIARTGSAYTDTDVHKLMLGHVVDQYPGVRKALSSMDEYRAKHLENIEANIRSNHPNISENQISRSMPKPSKLAKSAETSHKYYKDTKMPANPTSITSVDPENNRTNSAIYRFREREVEPHPELDLKWSTSKKKKTNG